MHRISAYARLVRLNRPIGILLLLWPTLWGLWFAAAGVPPFRLLLIFVTGTILMRSAGCAINDFADRDFDRHVARTRERPVTSGEIKPQEAVIVAAVLSLLALLLILPPSLPLNPRLLALAVVAALLAASYPFTKRFFAIPQAYLGIAFGFGIPMAYAAHLGQIAPVAWWLLLANVFWAVAYDTEYAMVDRDDDVKIGIKTAAITFGRSDVVMVMLCYLMTLLLLCAVGMALHMGFFYNLGLAVAAMIALYHYTLIRTREPARCFKAFLHNNWFGAAVFAGIALDYGMRP
ncbi:MAG: 4-hydroxybenzoate octaprenyltransferase [Burkholderiaceae bacterium]|nr:MAG: 4-hydroxybenzoate octaprenyltransferase [Burkholderiaceae bacterium]